MALLRVDRAAGREPRLYRGQAARDRGRAPQPLRASGEVIGLFSIAGQGGRQQRLHDLHARALGRARAEPAGDRRRHHPGRRPGDRAPRLRDAAELAQHPRRRAGAAVRHRREQLRHAGGRRGRAGEEDGGEPGLRTGAPLLRDDAAAALHQGRPREGVGPRHRHRRARRGAAVGARRRPGRLGLRRRPELRHQAHLDRPTRCATRRPREPVPKTRSGEWCRCRRW